MTYEEFQERSHFGQQELIAFAYGNLVEAPPEGFVARLPAPPFLMVDRILEIQGNGRQGRIVAEQDIRLDAWYFQCHMPGDPVQPGCLGVDAIWQLLGFFCTWRGSLGSGRALGCSEVVFSGQIRPFNRIVLYEIGVRRFTHLKESGASIVIGEGRISVDGEEIAEIHGAKTGVFQGISYPDYPRRSANSV
ncbi:MAG: bifunctional 3-hydroxydecanoyl-ACP dehydratase/trans-2-decenoyl-ACP isomerase, partial [Deltaproteobacteria bacterium]|nr:bifunctional 3-hydroxydecanoyl-ACP dehydratase/trans-2-decenoyl-ACP isomerase [Deltaproteobacteria bacterium]